MPAFVPKELRNWACFTCFFLAQCPEQSLARSRFSGSRVVDGRHKQVPTEAKALTVTGRLPMLLLAPVLGIPGTAVSVSYELFSVVTTVPSSLGKKGAWPRSHSHVQCGHLPVPTVLQKGRVHAVFLNHWKTKEPGLSVQRETMLS